MWNQGGSPLPHIPYDILSNRLTDNKEHRIYGKKKQKDFLPKWEKKGWKGFEVHHITQNKTH